MNQAERDSKIQTWIGICKNLEYLKNAEMELRKELSIYVLVDDKPESFSRTMHLGNGYGLEATQNLNYKIEKDNDMLESIIEWMIKNNEPAYQVFKPGYTFNESAYKKLAPNVKAIVDQVISCKIGAPKLEFIQPKAN